MTWYNADGLLVKFGTEEATVGKTGGYRIAGPTQVAELVLDDMTLLSATATIQDYNLVLPKGYRIEKVTVQVKTAATSGGAAVLNVGLSRTDTTTELDYNGLIAALALTAIDAVGEETELVVGSTGAGALIGTVLANNGYFTVDYDTAAYTAGKIIVRVYYSKDVA